MSDETGTIPVSIVTEDLTHFAVNIEVMFERTKEVYEKWQIDTYNKIMNAYLLLKEDYEESIREEENIELFEISGSNPVKNRVIEKDELKKSKHFHFH